MMILLAQITSYLLLILGIIEIVYGINIISDIGKFIPGITVNGTHIGSSLTLQAILSNAQPLALGLILFGVGIFLILFVNEIEKYKETQQKINILISKMIDYTTIEKPNK
jgi:hypothetical protein